MRRVVAVVAVLAAGGAAAVEPGALLEADFELRAGHHPHRPSGFDLHFAFHTYAGTVWLGEDAEALVLRDGEVVHRRAMSHAWPVDQSLGFDWDGLVGGAPVPDGRYDAVLRFLDNRSEPPRPREVWANDGAGFLVPGASASLRLEGPNQSLDPGQGADLTVQNAGAALWGPDCGPRVVTQLRGEVRNHSWLGRACRAGMLQLPPGGSLTVRWDPFDRFGAPTGPGLHRLVARFGGAEARADLRVPDPGAFEGPRVVVNAVSEPQQEGAHLLLGLGNGGTVPLEGVGALSVTSAEGRTVASFGPTPAQALVPGQNLLFAWDQRGPDGLRVAAGTYEVRGVFACHAASAQLALLPSDAEGPVSAGEAPDTVARTLDACSPAPPAPDEDRPRAAPALGSAGLSAALGIAALGLVIRRSR